MKEIVTGKRPVNGQELESGKKDKRKMTRGIKGLKNLRSSLACYQEGIFF